MTNRSIPSTSFSRTLSTGRASSTKDLQPALSVLLPMWPSYRSWVLIRPIQPAYRSLAVPMDIL